MRYYFRPLRLAIIKKKKKKIASAGENVEKLEPQLLVEMQNSIAV